MHQGKELLFYPASAPENPLNTIESNQAFYLNCYLRDLGAVSVIEEQNYFDRDYLAEFSAFYSLSSRGYPNICRRLHFFSTLVTRDNFIAALGNCAEQSNIIEESYLGFIVIRPIPSAPLGRTILSWFEDKDPKSKRVTNPSREYTANLAGLNLKVYGLAWQQQDTGVSACATVGLWTMLHSSAFDANHLIPTTADITKAAHNTASLGARVFPSKGLRVEQILEAIKEHKLAPLIISPDMGGFFSKIKLASSCASLIRSAYPALIIGEYVSQDDQPAPIRHMICAVGFREKTEYDIPPGMFQIVDASTDVIYIHDDNIGPNVRCEIIEDEQGSALIRTSPPDYGGEPKAPIEQLVFKPHSIIVAVHEELRISSDEFLIEGLNKASQITSAITHPAEQLNREPPSILCSVRFLDIRSYQNELGRLLESNSEILSKVRIGLAEKIAPMSLHIGLVRIAMNDDSASVLMDIIYDTTDSDRNRPIFANIIYDSVLDKILSGYPIETITALFGPSIPGYK